MPDLMLSGVLKENSISSIYFSAICEFKEQKNISLKTRNVIHAVNKWKPPRDEADLLSLVASLYSTVTMGHEMTWSMTKHYDHPYEGSLQLIREISERRGDLMQDMDTVIEETVIHAVLHSCRCRHFELGTKLVNKYKNLLTKNDYEELSKILIAKVPPYDSEEIPSSRFIEEHSFPGYLTKVNDWLNPLEEELASKSFVFRVASIWAEASGGSQGLLKMVDKHSADKLEQGAATHAETVAHPTATHAETVTHPTFRNRRKRPFIVRASSPKDPESSLSDSPSEGAIEHSAPKDIKKKLPSLQNSLSRKKLQPPRARSPTPASSPPPSSPLNPSPPPSPLSACRQTSPSLSTVSNRSSSSSTSRFTKQPCPPSKSQKTLPSVSDGAKTRSRKEPRPPRARSSTPASSPPPSSPLNLSHKDPEGSLSDSPSEGAMEHPAPKVIKKKSAPLKNSLSRKKPQPPRARSPTPASSPPPSSPLNPSPPPSPLSACRQTSPSLSTVSNRSSSSSTSRFTKQPCPPSKSQKTLPSVSDGAKNRSSKKPQPPRARSSTPASSPPPSSPLNLSHKDPEGSLSDSPDNRSTNKCGASVRDNFNRWLSKNNGWLERNTTTLKPRREWGNQESELLFFLVKIYGVGQWRKIVDRGKFNGRTNVHLKDRWRTMQKQGLIAKLEKKFGI